MGKFDKYAGDCKIEVGGEELDLDIRLKDVQGIMTAQQGQEMTKEGIKQMVDQFKEIILRSYPEEDENAVESFLTKNFIDFLTAFSEEMGWASEEELQQQADTMRKKV